MNIKKTSRLAMLTALSIVIGIIESYIPIFANIVPGLKLGLSNVIIILVLYNYNFKDALSVSLIRVFIIGLIRTGLFTIPFFFSLAGAILSIITMALAKKIKIFSLIGISIIGSISHSIGQILVGLILINKSIIYYLPYLLLFSIPTGLIVGIISQKLIKNMSNLN